MNNYNHLAPSRQSFLIGSPSQDSDRILFVTVSVARVQPRTSKGITDLLLPPASLQLNCKVPLRNVLYHLVKDDRII